MSRNSNRWLAIGLFALAAGLAVNAVLGPLLAEIVTFPFSETLLNQTIGLEAITLLVVVPWCVGAGILVLRNHLAGPVLAIPPAGYVAYMFIQYIAGPEYETYPEIMPLHMGIFILSGAVLVVAWNRIQVDELPTGTQRRTRIVAVILFLLAAFTISRYLSAIGGTVTGGEIPADFADDRTMYWLIFWLDLGVVVPVTVAAGISLLQGRSWAQKAVYGIVGWFALVPISVAAMSIVMLINDDPNAAIETLVVLSGAAVIFTIFAIWLYRPLFKGEVEHKQTSTDDAAASS